MDNNLGLIAAKKALDSIEKTNFFSTECIVEALEICLASNSCEFGEINFLQKHGTALALKNASSCVYRCMRNRQNSRN